MPASNSNNDLNRLVAALRSARDPWSRVKLVATGARVLARLPPRERTQLLHQLGLEGGEQLAALAAGGDPQLQGALEQALQRLEADPQRLQRLGAAIADPESRRSTLSGLASYLVEAVTAPPTPPGPAAPVAAKHSAPSPSPPSPAPAPAPVAVPIPAPVVSAPAPAPVVAMPPPVAPAPTPDLVAEPIAPPLPTPPAEQPLQRAMRTAGAIAAPTRPAPFAAADGAPLDDGLPSWARRRSLAALFARGEPSTVEEGLALVEEVPLLADRRWALADLARSRSWSDEEWVLVLGAADSPAARRRLALRRGGT